MKYKMQDKQNLTYRNNFGPLSRCRSGYCTTIPCSLNNQYSFRSSGNVLKSSLKSCEYAPQLLK